MNVRKRCVLLAAAGIGMLPSLVLAQNNLPPAVAAPVAPDPRAAAPHSIAAHNQKMADTIAASLRQSGVLRRYNVNIIFLNGAAELTGQVADRGQRDEILRIAHSVAGVERVVDRLALAEAGTVQPVQAVAPPPPVQPEMGPAPLRGQPRFDEAFQEPVPIFRAYPESMPHGGSGFTPMPNANALPNPATDPPRMPPYAWPTYAPYNNYSRVAYPTLYPYNAWPFIGPFYPVPKIPPGWRSVELKWNDGYWWYGRHATGHDWWRVRFR